MYVCLCDKKHYCFFIRHNTPAVYLGWDDWTEWGSCDVSCGGGTRMRTSVHLDKKMQDLSQKETCNSIHCPSMLQTLLVAHCMKHERALQTAFNFVGILLI